jgi:sugar lactone lactonase YvrE
MRLRSCAAAIAATLTVATEGAAQPRLDPADFPESLRATAVQIAPVANERPDDAAVLYQVAALLARAGRTPDALDALRRMEAAGTGVHPRLRDGFESLAAHPEFRAIVARIRRAAPPVRHATRAFVLPDGGMLPEGIAWSSRSRRFYFGGAGRIVSASMGGDLATFVSGSADGLGHVLGVRVDDARGELWAVSGSLDDPAPAGTIIGLFRFRLSDGSLVARYPIGVAADLLNDVAIAPDGAAFATESNSGALVRVAPGATTAEYFLPRGTLPDPNGVAASADGRFLFVAGWYGISRVDLRTRAVSVLPQPPTVASGCIDGLYLASAHTLVGVQNCVHESGRIMHYRLSAERDSIVSATVLDAYNPAFDGITTAAIAEGMLYFVANVQFRKFRRGAAPSEPFVPLEVVRLPLPPN